MNKQAFKKNPEPLNGLSCTGVALDDPLPRPWRPPAYMPRIGLPSMPVARHRLTVGIWQALLSLMLVITLASCGSLSKQKPLPPAPVASCGERVAAIDPGSPPDSEDYRQWAAAYVRAVWAWVDVTNKRAATADCIDKNRAIKP